MKYKLALELKKAGFPQESSGNYGDWYCDKEKIIFLVMDEEQIKDKFVFSYCPTISELIEACTLGNYNFSLSSGIVVGESSFIWTAKTRGKGAKGYSRIEAVAKLYIRLNKKI